MTLETNLKYGSYLSNPPGGEKAKHMRSGYSGFIKMANNAAAPAPRLWPVITSLLPYNVQTCDKHSNITTIVNKSCQKTTTLAKRQPSLNSSQGFNFSKVGQTSRSRSWGQKVWHYVKGLVTRNTHMQYESPIACGKKVMAKVKVFQK